MSHGYHAIAIDYDGTLAEGRPTADVLAAVADARESGRKVVLVTGRIAQELRGEFPELDRTFDAIVFENGCELQLPGRPPQLLVRPVDPELDEALRERDVPYRRGAALIATEAIHDLTVLSEVHRLGLDCQLVCNRNALMVLPAGTSKGTGLYRALGELGVSHHSALAVGDAENDHALLEICEVGVAVANAVPSLKAHADVVLGGRDGTAVAGLLRGPITRGELRVPAKRWRIALGRGPEGERVSLPGSQVNVLVTGGSAQGKSFLAGLMAERLLSLGYALVILDPEGDHEALAHHHGVVRVTPRDITAAELPALLHRRFQSVLADLSGEDEPARALYMSEALAALALEREATGLPHWIVLDEAQLVAGAPVGCGGLDLRQGGFCLVTWRPEQLAPGTVAELDAAVAVPSPEGLVLPPGTPDGDELTALAASLPLGSAALALRGEPVRTFALEPRLTRHFRHLHKYAERPVARERAFVFRDPTGPTGRVAATLSEFVHELERSSDAVLRHHLLHRDFSAWIEGVFKDEPLAARVREAERLAAQGEVAGRGRARLLAAFHQRGLAA